MEGDNAVVFLAKFEYIVVDLYPRFHRGLFLARKKKRW